MTNVFEISVAPQKNVGGLVSVYINATIHGKAPRVKFCPRTISPDLIFGTPQVSAPLCDRWTLKTEDSVAIAYTAITIKRVLIIFFLCQRSTVKFCLFHLNPLAFFSLVKFSSEITKATDNYLATDIIILDN